MNHIAIIDDDSEIVKIFRYVAESAGFTVDATSDHKEFFQMIDATNPTHILLDLQMPEMDGVEIIRHLAEKHYDAKLFLVSGFDPKVIEIAAKLAKEQGLEVAECINKPVSSKTLKDKLIEHKNDSALDKKSLLKAFKNKEFYLKLQPKILAKSRMLAGFECLMRWKHPVKGELAPDYFIPALEELGLFKERVL